MKTTPVQTTPRKWLMIFICRWIFNNKTEYVHRYYEGANPFESPAFKERPEFSEMILLNMIEVTEFPEDTIKNAIVVK